MKTNFFYIILLIVALSSCKEEEGKMNPGTIKIIPFDAKLSTTEFKVGEPVTFQMEGNADTIHFYSGEIGKDYNFIGGREAFVESPTMTIQTRSDYGEQESLTIKISQDFNGDYSYAGINAATWDDINFNIPTPKGATRVDYTPNPVNIESFIKNKDQPYYIAVRNDIKTSSTNNKPVQWYFLGTQFAFKGLVNGVFTDISTFGNMGWKVAVNGYLGGVLDGTKGPRLSPNPPATPTSLFLARNSTSTVAMDTWAVTKAFASKVNLGPDKPTIIKSAETTLPLEKYTYTYNTPGEYNVTFHGRNKDGGKTLVHLTITVTP